MRLFTKILSTAMMLVYITVSLFSLSNCTKTADGTTVEQLNSSKQKTASLLLHKFDAEIFNLNSRQFLNRTVVLDSTLIEIFKKDEKYFLKAEVKVGGSKKCFALLKCSSEIADSYRRTKSNEAFLAAKINRIDNSFIVAEMDSLEGKQSILNLGESVLLSGECIALVEIPSLSYAD